MSEDQVVESQEQAPEPELFAKVTPTQEMPVVDINRATAAELSRLPGITAKMAARIVDYRREHPFREPAEITQVKGVSKAVYAGIADLITAGPEEPALSAENPDRTEWVEPEAAAPVVAVEAAVPVVAVEAAAPEVAVEAAASVAQEPERPKRAAVVQEVPPPPPSRTMPLPERERARGLGWLAVLAVGLVSAIAGACLALLLLLAVNGTLEFGQAATVKDMQATDRQLNAQVDQLNSDLSQMQGQMDDMQGSLQAMDRQLQAMQGDLEALDKQLADTQAELKATDQQVNRMSEGLRAVQDQFGAVKAQLGELQADLKAVRQTTQRFDAFLTGLRELLDRAQGPAPILTPIPPETRSPLAPNPTAKPEFTVIPQTTPTP